MRTTWYIQARGPEAWIYQCVLAPLGSPTVVQKRVSAMSGTAVTAMYGCGYTARTGIRVGTGWVYRVGNTGPSTKDGHLKSGAYDSEAGPGSPSMGLEWVVICTAPPSVRTPPSGPGRAPEPSLGAPRANAASWPIKARIRPLFSKVSQNRIVSPEYTHKACHSPYSQNGLGKSPLKILRFPFSLAFSHKELLGHI